MRFFNTAGPVNPADHYCLDPLSRFDLEEIFSLIRQKKYFVLHAPRQTGKTSCMLALMQYLNDTGEYLSLYTNIESAQAAREDVTGGIRSVMSSIGIYARDFLGNQFVLDHDNEILQERGAYNALEEVLSRWSSHEQLPIVLIIDEVDALIGDTLISLLRQLRSGYSRRPANFPSSIILCGVRDVRDYRIYSDQEKSIITGGSAFNIKAESLRLGNFSKIEVKSLCLQHTEETGQKFEPEALEKIWENSQGQPWLVNALGYEVCFKMETGKNRSVSISPGMIEEAKTRLILRHETHLDQLADKLREERVRRIVEPMIEGTSVDSTINDDDLSYVMDLGLVTRGPDGLQIANSIYREVIPRQLTTITSYNLEATIPRAPFIRPDGRLDTRYLFTEFQQFYRENSGSWLEIAQYREAGPQLLLMAFLQRVVNGGGRIEREYGLGRGRLDLLIIWSVQSGETQRIVIECKVLHHSYEKTIRDGLSQTYRYADTCSATESHLVIFDRTPEKPWDEKIFNTEEVYSGTEDHPVMFLVTVWGM
ncbi:AAA-like domain-containing protein [Methanospirillum stamsii]|uniref:AAA+ ATPase domain-containing protein n=1 Tax=Methanospirillum stamsii TaxID=1277351 RepID=A0A2V2N4I8_9EURY|nr:AAA-like domain-containing protein [Methanospirillum stamsii]PWR73510.1 hypothetical protein DLD82_09710 [Methanospirillum stamsii]